MKSQPDNSHRGGLNHTAQQIAQKLTTLKVPMEKQLNINQPWMSLIALGLLAICVNTALHLWKIYTLHRSKKFHKFLPFSHKLDNQEVQLKPIIMVNTQKGLKMTRNSDRKIRVFWFPNLNYAKHTQNYMPQFNHNWPDNYTLGVKNRNITLHDLP